MLNYKDTGKGRDVLLVHGNFASHKWWNEVLDSPPRSTRLVAPDMMGFGQSKVETPFFHPTIPQYAEGLISFVTSLGLKDMTVVGHSLGGAVVMHMLSLRPDLFHSVMLLDSAPVDGMKTNQSLKSILPMVKYNRNILAYMLSTSMPHRIPDNFSDLVSDAQAMHLKSFAGNVKALEDWKIPESSKDYKGNVYVVRGEDDKLITNDMNVKTANQFRNNRVFCVKNSGHSPQIENPIEFRNLMVKLMEE